MRKLKFQFSLSVSTQYTYIYHIAGNFHKFRKFLTFAKLFFMKFGDQCSTHTFTPYTHSQTPPTHTHKLRPRTVGRLLKAAESAATYQGMVPSDEVMSNNVRYYTNKYKLQPEDFTPREVGKLYCVYFIYSVWWIFKEDYSAFWIYCLHVRTCTCTS